MTRPVAVVTGGAGFIGSHMVDRLVAEGFAVRVIDDFSGGHRSNLEHVANDASVSIHEADIREIDAHDGVFSAAKVLLHFAGIGDIVPSIERPIDYLAVNVQGTVRVLEGARLQGIPRVVYAASSSCYGLATTPTSESHPIDCRYPYALSKYLGECAALHWARVYGLSVNSIRIFNAYGPRSRTTGAYGAVFGVFLRQKLAGRPFTVVGDGSQRRDFLFVTDVADAFWRAATTEHTGCIWNLGAGSPQSVNRLVELLGGDTEYLPKRPGEPDCTWADTTAIRRDLGWMPSVSFEEGVQRLVMEINRWKDAPLWDRSRIAQATTTWFKYLGD